MGTRGQGISAAGPRAIQSKGSPLNGEDQRGAFTCLVALCIHLSCSSLIFINVQNNYTVLKVWTLGSYIHMKGRPHFMVTLHTSKGSPSFYGNITHV